MTSKPAPKTIKSPLERMTELTRRLVAVPKSEMQTKRKPQKAKRVRNS